MAKDDDVESELLEEGDCDEHGRLIKPFVRRPGEPDHWTFYLKPGDDIRDDSHSRRSARRRMIEAHGREAVAKRGKGHQDEWATAKRRWDNGPQYLKRAEFERVTEPRRCEAPKCDAWFPATRRDQKTCSGKCRTALCRHRAAAKSASR